MKPATIHDRYVSFLSKYVALPDPRWFDVLALWALGTWVYASQFDAFPYLVVTSATKRSGKTRLGVEILPRLCYNPTSTGAITPAMLYRTIEQDADHGLTLTFDESERLFNEGSGLREFLNMGYRSGQTIMRMGAEGQPEKFRVYCPKVFVLIGDVYDTLRDRSIVMELTRANYDTMRKLAVYRESVVAAEAAEITGGLSCDAVAEMLGNLDLDKAFLDALEFLDSRDAEIWAPLFAMASALCPDKLSTIKRVAADLAGAKTADARRAAELREQEAAKQGEAYGERALRDLAGLMAHKRVLDTEQAIAALKDIDTAPWRTYKGRGLDSMMLASLLAPFGVKPKVCRISKTRTARGYQVADIKAALGKLS